MLLYMMGANASVNTNFRILQILKSWIMFIGLKMLAYSFFIKTFIDYGKLQLTVFGSARAQSEA